MYFYNGCFALSKKTLSVIVASGNDAIVQIKGNQETIYSEAIGITQEGKCISKDCERIDKGHGRIVRREARVFEVDKTLKNTCNEWKEVKCIIEVKRIRKVNDTGEKKYKTSIELSYYISTRILTAKEALQIIRDHWKIENKNHCVKDITFNEDKSRIRVNPIIFAILRSLALNILRVNNVKNIADARDRNKMNIEYILNYKGIA